MEIDFYPQLLSIMHERLPKSKNRSVMIREAIMAQNGLEFVVDKVLLDTGASAGNYIGQEVLHDIPNVVYKPCRHRVKLGDNVTYMYIEKYVELYVAMYNDYGELTEYILTEFYVAETLGKQAIIGLPSLLDEYYNYFESILKGAAKSKQPKHVTDQVMVDLHHI